MTGGINQATEKLPYKIPRANQSSFVYWFLFFICVLYSLYTSPIRLAYIPAATTFF